MRVRDAKFHFTAGQSDFVNRFAAALAQVDVDVPRRRSGEPQLT